MSKRTPTEPPNFPSDPFVPVKNFLFFFFLFVLVYVYVYVYETIKARLGTESKGAKLSLHELNLSEIETQHSASRKC